MKPNLKKELIERVKTVCERKKKNYSEEKAEELIHRLQSLWAADHPGMDQDKAKESVKNAIKTWYEAKSYAAEINDPDIEKMADAVFSK